MSEEILFNIIVKNLLQELNNLLNIKLDNSETKLLMGILINDRIESCEPNNRQLKIVS